MEQGTAQSDVRLDNAAHAAGPTAGPSLQIRQVDLLEPHCLIETRPDGTRILRSHEALGAYPGFLTDRLEHWARVAPDRTAFAQRDPAGHWRRIDYRGLLRAVRSVGEALIARGLSLRRPVAILSENDIEQAVLVLACQYVSVPVAPVSPTYSLISQDYERLRHVMDLVRPGLIFAGDAARFQGALAALKLGDAEIVSTSSLSAVAGSTPFADLLGTTPGAAVNTARDNRHPDDTAKILFTSGSTGVPKGVINTHRMIAANQQMIAQVYRFLQSEPPVILDWLPWHHTFGGNHNFGMAVYNGGSFYIDDGKPTPQGIAKTVRNLMDVSPTIYFNVPRGYADLVRHLDADPVLAECFFRNLNFMFYSGASLDHKLWDALVASSVRTTGRSVPILTSLGSTETAPAAIASTHIAQGPGEIGLPIPGVEAKLVPSGEKLELRLRGPNVMPGYHRQSDLTATCFDEEGFYKIGDAVHWVDPSDPDRGLAFDGRIAEDFKLSSGTWVNVAAIKSRLMAAFAPYVRDVVVVGADRETLGALLIPDLTQMERDFDDGDRQTLHPALGAQFQATLDAIPAKGSSERVDRVAIIASDLSIDQGEVTDKGSINSRRIAVTRAALVDALFDVSNSAGLFFVRTAIAMPLS